MMPGVQIELKEEEREQVNKCCCVLYQFILHITTTLQKTDNRYDGVNKALNIITKFFGGKTFHLVVKIHFQSTTKSSFVFFNLLLKVVFPPIVYTSVSYR